MANQKCFSTVVFVFAMVTLLSLCSPVTSFLTLPRVSRTSDAVIIDYEGIGYSPLSVGRGYGEIVDPGFIPLAAFHPYVMVQQPQPMFYSGWYNVGRQAAPACGKGPLTVPTSRTLASERLAGGTAAKKGVWPFMVALRNTTGGIFCSGSLVSDSRVMIAAQCLEKMSVFDISGVTVLVGMHKTDQTDVQMTRRISKVVIHSGYNAATYANDIAIVSLDMPVVLSKTVSTVCLPPASTDADQYIDSAAIVLGYNATTALEQALVAMDSYSNCRADTTIGQYVSENTTCITSAASNVFTCLKDIGGPVVIGLPPAAPATSPVTWTVVGINSFTLDCTKGGLKTRVAAYRSWIDTYMV